ncbi:MAG: hypothetical protein GY828_02035 [Candidatus Gracilibacteria bacterium]|nr:hypothetical protein [Candidatus Gracilibacteria bacterium]
MTTITFKEDIQLEKTVFQNLEEFMSQIAYEEQLEEKLVISKASQESDFVNI